LCSRRTYTRQALIIISFFISSGTPGDLHSFPTRRSSDLARHAVALDGRKVSAAVEGLAVGREKHRHRPAAVTGHHLHAVHDRSRSEEHTSELQSLAYLVCRLLLEKKKWRA